MAVRLVESSAFARERPFHPYDLTHVPSAMWHSRDELREAGRDVASHRIETVREAVERRRERAI